MGINYDHMKNSQLKPGYNVQIDAKGKHLQLALKFHQLQMFLALLLVTAADFSTIQNIILRQPLLILYKVIL